jgi:hypothetical protein
LVEFYELKILTVFDNQHSCCWTKIPFKQPQASFKLAAHAAAYTPWLGLLALNLPGFVNTHDFMFI